MASVKRRKGSPFWVGCFALPEGSIPPRGQRSTKTKDKSKALQIAIGWERAAAMKATADQAQKVLADIVKAVSGETFAMDTAHGYADRWMARVRRELAERTVRSYQAVADEFKGMVAKHVALAHVPQTTIAELRDNVAKRNSIATANLSLTIIKAMFSAAWDDGVILENVATKVKPLNPKKEQAEKTQRRTFTLTEIQAVLGVLEPEDEWFGMVLFGTYTGQRLNDIAKLATRATITNGVWAFKSQKTGLNMRVALAAPVSDWIRDYAPKKGPLFPDAYETGRSGTLSNRFHAIMARAGLVSKRLHRKKSEGKGRSSSREASEISFHSFRHTTQTLLMEGGISRELAMAFIGHENEDTSKGYTHIGVDALKKAALVLPNVVTSGTKKKRA